MNNRFVKWVASYITTHCQVVNIGEFLPKAISVKFGVLQGPIIGHFYLHL